MNDHDFEVPARQVMHDFDDDEFDSFAPMGKMTSAAKAAARRRRERFDELGGFGFVAPRSAA